MPEHTSPSIHARSRESSSAFRLRPLRAARVSEISETTAASQTDPEERVNFHIGNPVQDERLSSTYLRMVLSLDLRHTEVGPDATEKLIAEREWDSTDAFAVEFLRELIIRSAPYTPRGGFAKNHPHRVVEAFVRWLQQQQEPLAYDQGAVTGKRELVLASGGIVEALRVFFHMLGSSLVELPSEVFLYGTNLCFAAESFRGLTFASLPSDENRATARLRERLLQSPDAPHFLVLGVIPGEEMRRMLRQLSIETPLMFIEVNDAPNHLSLAREAKLVHRVIRLLTPAVFFPRLRSLSTIFVAGNAEFLQAFESVHFQLKGTPSASEIELLSSLIDRGIPDDSRKDGVVPLAVEPPFEGFGTAAAPGAALFRQAHRVGERLEAIIERHAPFVSNLAQKLIPQFEGAIDKLQHRRSLLPVDRFALTDARTLVHELMDQATEPAWVGDLSASFLQAFLKHYPEYRPADCIVVSGSSRTALGLLGFHCGIREAIVPDLSWSYEHCFPHVEAVPLTPAYEIDDEGILATVRRKLNETPDWSQRGAVVINNPHNATGRVFDGDRIRRLVSGLLDLGVFVIDDLSYRQVAPGRDLPDIRTIRQVADELVLSGYLPREREDRVITVQSVSKTDCLAGARLAVVEIRHRALQRQFADAVGNIAPNTAAILLTYLFYRNDRETSRAYWRLRNEIFLERTEALMYATESLPRDRNIFDISILPPSGSMYPLMVISRLPPGLSLDWLASGLAQQGIGILPLSTFARTGQGYEAGRKTFRLTLGGTDGAEELKSKTRRVLIDLNRLIAQEASRYNRERYPSGPFPPFLPRTRALTAGWQDVEQQIIGECSLLRETGRTRAGGKVDPEEFQSAYLPERLAAFRLRCADRAAIVEGLLSNGVAGRSGLIEQLGRECTKDSLERRSLAFQNRLYDRTVHPTQMYSIQVERVFERIIGSLIRRDPVPPQDLRLAARELLDEYLGRNVAISSEQESEELVLDLDALIAAEHWQELETGASAPGFISFWGDWDGSNRPSGQGHQLVATTLMTNVARLARLIVFFARAESDAGIDRSLLVEIGTLPEKERRFSRLLNDITRLTHQLERRYRGILPFRIRPSGLRSLGMRLHLARDPLTLLWHHNDRLERRMLELRKRRREALEYYFALNKRLRKQVHALLPRLERQSADHPLVREVLLYRDLLQRMIITPRVHQSMVTAQDSFAIDTTVYNIFEINEIAGRYGNPAMILALQVSMSTKSEALISLDRKMRARREQTLREHPGIALPSVQIIPLFEDAEAIEAIPAYLDKVWEYALQSRRIDQETPDRFAEIISEVFIAGSDISQQVGQAAGASAYHSAKSKFALWLSEHGLVDHVHIKMGSGEPMQRQGGYYAPQSGEPAFNAASPALQDRHAALPAAARKSTEYATTPLMGIFSGGDIRTFQGALSEQLRYLPARELAQVLHHLRVAQQRHRADLSRAAESLSESRLTRHKRVTRELERLTIGTSDPVHDRFTSMVSSDFRQILYGREEDVLGIHVISYFIARATPQLRDRPTVRPESGTDEERGQKILGRIERMIPLATRGSLLRAIAHNQAQTMVLGINQLTTGLFRALHRFSQMEMQEGDPETMIVERVLPRLPVYEILLSLRLYHDPALPWLQEIEAAFPAGNSAFPALREDNDAIQRFIGLLQQELLRRHGLAVDNFFENGVFNPSLLPALRPDLALLMQGDIYNCDMSRLLEGTGGEANGEWLQSIRRTIELPAKIRTLRAKIWEFLKEPIFERVQSFAELAQALHTLSTRENLEVAEERAGRLRISGEISQLMRTARAADEMRDFLLSSVRYLSAISEGMVEVPIAIVRSMREVERIAKIEEHALLPREQELLRCYTLRIARMTGESG